MPSAPTGRDRRLHFFRPPAARLQRGAGPGSSRRPVSQQETAAIGRTDSMKRITKKPRKTPAHEPDFVPDDKPPVSQPAGPPSGESSRLHEEEPVAETPALDEDL